MLTFQLTFQSLGKPADSFCLFFQLFCWEHAGAAECFSFSQFDLPLPPTFSHCVKRTDTYCICNKMLSKNKTLRPMRDKL